MAFLNVRLMCAYRGKGHRELLGGEEGEDKEEISDIGNKPFADWKR
jgi:hypothetical protein